MEAINSKIMENNMNLKASTGKVLELLAENLTKNPSPQVVPSENIADKLAMNLNDTKQLLKVLDGLGFITIDIDGQHSIITHNGLQWLSGSYS
jgi:tRNA G26 N,N-dimethylase Trm1